MADVNVGGGDGPTRGQLILLGGIIIAVILVGLALLVNSSIFTANLATRGDSGTGQEPARVSGSIIGGVTTGLERVNREHAGASYETLHDELAGVVERIGNSSERAGAGSGSVVRVTTEPWPDGTYNGTRVVDDDGGSATDGFVNRSGGTDWVVADGHVRAFEMTVDRNDLAADPASLTDLLENGDGETAFVVEVDAPDAVHRAAVYDDGTGVVVEVYDAGTDTTTACQGVAASTVTIDVTGGTVGGERCDALADVTSESGSYRVDYLNGDLVGGTYELTVDRSRSLFRERVNRLNAGRFCIPSDGNDPDPTFHDDATAGTPYVERVLWSATVDVTVEAENSYTTRRTVAPGLAGARTTVPSVQRFTVTDQGSGQFQIGWAVRDPDGDLATVDVRLDDPDGTGSFATPGSALAVGDERGSGTLTLDAAGNSPVDATVEVEDDAGNSWALLQEHAADGDDTGCGEDTPP